MPVSSEVSDAPEESSVEDEDESVKSCSRVTGRPQINWSFFEGKMNTFGDSRVVISMQDTRE